MLGNTVKVLLGTDPRSVEVCVSGNGSVLGVPRGLVSCVSLPKVCL